MHAGCDRDHAGGDRWRDMGGLVCAGADVRLHQCLRLVLGAPRMALLQVGPALNHCNWVHLLFACSGQWQAQKPASHREVIQSLF